VTPKLLGVGATRGLALASLVVLVACGSSHPSPQTSPHTSAPASAKTSGPAPSTSADTPVAWARDGGLDKIDAVTTDLSEIHAAGSDAAAVRQGCEALASSVSAAQFYRPVPQAQAQAQWAAALTAFKAAAVDCLDGIDENDTVLLKRAASEIDQGTTHLAATTKTLRIT
jgi:hypothetical protein